VHRNTARKLLRHLHNQYGSKVVWQVGPHRALVATRASLQVVRVLRAERNLILVIPGAERVPTTPGPTPLPRRDDGAEDLVTQDQHASALAQVWKALESLGARRF
jgi:hypothetical protein